MIKVDHELLAQLRGVSERGSTTVSSELMAALLDHIEAWHEWREWMRGRECQACYAGCFQSSCIDCGAECGNGHPDKHMPDCKLAKLLYGDDS